MSDGISLPAALGIAFGTFILGGFGGCATGYVIGSPSATSTSASDNKGADEPAVFAAPTTTTQVAMPPSPSDFQVDIVVTEQKCFGSAGCSYELSINPRYVGLGTVTGKWMVVYELTGGEDPQTGNFTLDGDRVRWDDEKRISGDAGAVFAARVTQVVKQY